jgi:serine/threonine-protein kinase RsbW
MRREPDLHLTFTSGPRATAEVRQAVEAFCRRCGLSDEECFDLKLAATEALTNALKRTSEPHTVEVMFRGDEQTVEVEVFGRGVFSPLRAALARGPDAEGGRGIALMFALVDDVAFERTPEGTRVRLRKHCTPSRALRLAG